MSGRDYNENVSNVYRGWLLCAQTKKQSNATSGTVNQKSINFISSSSVQIGVCASLGELHHSSKRKCNENINSLEQTITILMQARRAAMVYLLRCISTIIVHVPNYQRDEYEWHTANTRTVLVGG